MTRKVQVCCVFNYGSHREYETVDGVAINRVFAAHRVDRFCDWTLTHRQSGYSAGCVRTLTCARRFAAALLRHVPATEWDFSDGEHVRKNPRFLGCKALKDKFEAMGREP